MVRNLGILKIPLLMPTLSDQYNAGPLEVSFTINPTTKIGTLKKHNKNPAIVRSKKRFILFFNRRRTQTDADNYMADMAS